MCNKLLYKNGGIFMSLETNYYEEKILSTSTVKHFLANPARALDDWNGVFPWFSEKSPELNYGSYVHAKIQDDLEGTDKNLTKFREQTPELFKKDGKSLLAKYMQSEHNANTFLASKTFQSIKEYAKDKEMFVEKAFLGTVQGVDFKGKLDLMIVDEDKKVVTCVDFKTSKKYDPSGLDWYEDINGERKHGLVIWENSKLYPIQAGVYRELLRQNGYQDYEIKYSFDVITKEATPRIDVWKISSEAMNEGWDMFTEGLLNAHKYITGQEKPPVINDGSAWANKRTWEKPNVLVAE